MMKTSTPFSGIVWTAIQGLGNRGVQFIVELIMARVLMPEDFGLIGMLSIFLAIAQTLMDSGFSNALIQRQSKDDIDFSTVFVFNFVVSVILYVIFYISAPLIASFYNAPELISITRILTLSIIINSFSIVNRTKLTIRLDFKALALISLASSLFAGAIGIILVYSGAGVMSLVVYTLTMYIAQTLLYCLKLKWEPSFSFSKESFKTLFSFGGNLLLANLLSNIYSNIYSIAIGKKYTTTDLGYYTKAEQFTSFSISSIGVILAKVSFPLMSSVEDKDEELPKMYKHLLSISSYAVFPISFYLIFYANAIIDTLLTDKWLSMVVILQLLCIDWMWDPMCKINANILLVLGKSKLILRLEVVKRILSITILFLTLPFGIKVLCYGRVAYSVIAVIINTYYTGCFFPQINILKQLRIVLPYICCAILSYGLSSIFIVAINNSLLKMIIGFLFGSMTYIVLTQIFKIGYLENVKKELINN